MAAAADSVTPQQRVDQDLHLIVIQIKFSRKLNQEWAKVFDIDLYDVGNSQILLLGRWFSFAASRKPYFCFGVKRYGPQSPARGKSSHTKPVTVSDFNQCMQGMGQLRNVSDTQWYRRLCIINLIIAFNDIGPAFIVRSHHSTFSILMKRDDNERRIIS